MNAILSSTNIAAIAFVCQLPSSSIPIIRSFHSAKCKSGNNHCILSPHPFLGDELFGRMSQSLMHLINGIAGHTSCRTCWLCQSTMWFWWPALWKQVVVLFSGSSSRMRNSGHLRRPPRNADGSLSPPRLLHFSNACTLSAFYCISDSQMCRLVTGDFPGQLLEDLQKWSIRRDCPQLGPPPSLQTWELQLAVGPHNGTFK